MISIPSYLKPGLWYHLFLGFKIHPWKKVGKINDINIEELEKEGIKGIIFDVDNTLTIHNQREIHPDIAGKFHDLCNKFKCVIFSNCKRDRYLELKEMFSIPVVAFGQKKPSPSGYKKALEIMNLTSGETAMVGDRILTDILGANKLGIKSVLVEPFDAPEPGAITLMRKLERFRLLISKKKS